MRNSSMASFSAAKGALVPAVAACWACVSPANPDSATTRDPVPELLETIEHCAVSWSVTPLASENAVDRSNRAHLMLWGEDFFPGPVARRRVAASEPRAFAVPRDELGRLTVALGQRGFFADAEVRPTGSRLPRSDAPPLPAPGELKIRMTCCNAGCRSWTLRRRGPAALDELYAAHANVEPFFAHLIWDLVEASSGERGTAFLGRTLRCDVDDDPSCWRDAEALTDCHGAPLPLDTLRCSEDSDCTIAKGKCRQPIAVRSELRSVAERRLLQGCGALSCGSIDEVSVREATCSGGICRLEVPSAVDACSGSGPSSHVGVVGDVPKEQVRELLRWIKPLVQTCRVVPPEAEVVSLSIRSFGEGKPASVQVVEPQAQPKFASCVEHTLERTPPPALAEMTAEVTLPLRCPTLGPGYGRGDIEGAGALGR